MILGWINFNLKFEKVTRRDVDSTLALSLGSK
jgi:hypothetical protein